MRTGKFLHQGMLLFFLLALMTLNVAACGDIVDRVEDKSVARATARSTTSPTPTVVKLKPTATPPPLPPTSTPRPSPTPTRTPSIPPTEPAADSTPAPTPTPAPAITDVMMEIPAGAFLLGNDNSEQNEGPAQKMDLPAFSIDAYEISNADFAAFVDATGYQTYREQQNSPQNWRWVFPAGKENNPVVFVTFFDAQAFCQWAGKRLPTEFEWEKAARGPDGFLFPWGNTYDPTMFNGKDSGQRRTLPVGTFPANPYGLFDVAGNVKEWVASAYQAYPGSNYQDPFYNPETRGLRGGGWFDEEAFVTTTNRNGGDPTITANDDIGFRCAKDKE